MEALLSLIIVIAVIGLIVWAITAIAPMPAPFQKIIYVLSVVFIALYALKVLGLLPAHF